MATVCFPILAFSTCWVTQKKSENEYEARSHQKFLERKGRLCSKLFTAVERKPHRSYYIEQYNMSEAALRANQVDKIKSQMMQVEMRLIICTIINISMIAGDGYL